MRPRIAIYDRHSTDRQNPTSSADQVQACGRVVDYLAGDVVATYASPTPRRLRSASRPRPKRRSRYNRARSVLRELLAAALATPQPSVPAIDPLMDRILDALAHLAVKVDACSEASEHAAVNAFAAYATTRLHALKMLPQEQQRPFVEQLAPNVARVVQP